MKAIVDPDICTACGLCIDMCPDVFEMKSSVAVAKVEEVPDREVECAREAAATCPVEAIEIRK